jgi:hypothetical protein
MRDGPTIRRKLRCCLLWQASSCQWYGLDLFLEREGRGWITIKKRHLHQGGCAGSVKCRGGSPSASVPPTHRTSTTAPPSTGTSIKNTCSWNVDEPYGITLCETANYNPRAVMQLHYFGSSLIISLHISGLYRSPPTMSSRHTLPDLSALKISLPHKTRPSKAEPPLQRCARKGCVFRQPADDARTTRSHGGWLCSIHKHELRLSVASMMWINEEVMTERKQKDSKVSKELKKGWY